VHVNDHGPDHVDADVNVNVNVGGGAADVGGRGG
jgi:hypothetical protein